MQLLNIVFISVTLEIFQCEILREAKLLQPLNILLISVTFEVSQLDKSSEVKALQL